MSKETPKAVHDPWPRLKGDWAVYEASQDSKILATFEMFATHDFSSATRDFVLDDLERQAIHQYGVPYDRVPEVFGKAEAKIWQEMEANGQA